MPIAGGAQCQCCVDKRGRQGQDRELGARILEVSGIRGRHGPQGRVMVSSLARATETLTRTKHLASESGEHEREAVVRDAAIDHAADSPGVGDERGGHATLELRPSVVARRAWKPWLGWASRSQIPAMIKVARTIRKHLEGIVNAVLLRATNALSEWMNAKISESRLALAATGIERRSGTQSCSTSAGWPTIPGPQPTRNPDAREEE